MRFEFDEKQTEKMGEWLQKHILECSYWQPDYILKHGGGDTPITYAFTPSKNGLVTEVQCKCGQKTDVTDYDRRAV